MILKFLKNRVKKYTSLFFWRKKSLQFKLAFFYLFIPFFRPNIEIINYLHINKTGGTAFKNTFSKKMVIGNFLIKIRNHEVRLRDIKEGEKIVFTVRDPILRFVSGFNCALRKGLPRHNLKWSKEEESTFEVFKSPNDLASNLYSDVRAQRAIKSCRHIKTSYWDWFESEEYLESRKDDVLFVFRQENLESDFNFFVKNFLKEEGLKLPKDQVLSHKSPPNYDKHLGLLAVENLKKWYNKDYEFLNYIKKIGILKDD